MVLGSGLSWWEKQLCEVQQGSEAGPAASVGGTVGASVHARMSCAAETVPSPPTKHGLLLEPRLESGAGVGWLLVLWPTARPQPARCRAHTCQRCGLLRLLRLLHLLLTSCGCRAARATAA